ncbi:MAG: DUF2071 domain-containing protein [Acidimicrobiia bacterium]|nr:DUF2071 domain-containing protein [Acidimicrobiia bacterium]
MAGTIDRRITVNLRLDPAVIQGILPRPFQPRLVGGYAMAGLDLVRLARLRPAFLPSAAGGFTAETAAHRVAVTWREGDDICRGAYMPRRDTSSRLTAAIGGRLFPGVHRLASFAVDEGGGRFDVEMRSRDGTTRVHLIAHTTGQVRAGSVFGSIRAATEFFEGETLGYAPSLEKSGVFEGLELRVESWEISPLEVEVLETSFFDDTSSFPAGSVEVDSALLMRGIPHEWRSRDPIVTAPTVGT